MYRIVRRAARRVGSRESQWRNQATRTASIESTDRCEVADDGAERNLSEQAGSTPIAFV